MNYIFQDGKLKFEDGVEYTLEEALLLSINERVTQDDLAAIHLVKKMFNGEIIGYDDFIPEDTRYLKDFTPGPSPDRRGERVEAESGIDPLAELSERFNPFKESGERS